jgi:hypothetical protein
MLKYQREIAPFVPHLDELAFLFGYTSKGSAVQNQLHNMIDLGLVIIRERGCRVEYYAIEKEIK